MPRLRSLQLTLLISLLYFALPVCGDDLRQTANNILLYQRNTGGWPKNYDRDGKLSETERTQLKLDKAQTDSTIDNGATHREIRILAKAYHRLGNQPFRDAAIAGVKYLLQAQYDNGGWPQYYPQLSSYHQHITYNDDAMIGVMDLFRNIVQGTGDLEFVSSDIRRQCDRALQRGLQCILKTQIRVDGKLTAWCAQHDVKTLAPAKARSYELPSISGNESVGIVRYLMKIENPDNDVVAAIEGAISWFESAQLKGLRQIKIEAPAAPHGMDIKIIPDPSAPPLWARFYDLQTQQPFFCSRDGIPKKTIAEISHERRNGYSWLGTYAAELLQKHYPQWKTNYGSAIVP